MEKNRGSWSSNFGFIMAAAGSAVGLGNLWKFPYLAGQNGGGAFVLIYLVLVVVMGFTLMLGELAIGRATNLDAYGAYNKLKKGWGFIGGIGILTGFLILSYYSVVGGWVIKYIVASTLGSIGADKGAFFTNFIASPVEPIIYHLIFMGLTVLIVIKGVSGGIEKASKVMMPALIGLLLIVVIRSITLPGAGEGLAYYLTPDFSKITFKVFVAAMGQVFFSLSLGMGCMITYGSYVKKDEDLAKDALIIPSLDTLVALLAGFAILPAVFALGFEPGGGPGLMFITLPAVFENMPLGYLISIAFFILVFFAAITSSISLLEVTVAYGIDQLKMTRQKAVLLFSLLMFVIGIAASLSMGVWKDILIPFIDGKSYAIFDLLDVITSYYLLPIGGLLMAIFIGFVWGLPNAVKEIKIGSTFPTEKLWSVLIKYIAPIGVFLILLSSTGLLDKLLGA